MMKRHVFKGLVLLLLLSLLTGVGAQGQEIAFTYGPVQVTVLELLQRTAAYAQRGQIESEKDYQAAIDLMIRQQLVIELKAKEWGLDQFSGEETEEMRKEASDLFEEMLDSYVQRYAAAASLEDQQALRSELVEYWGELGTTVDSAYEALQFERMSDRVFERIQTTVTEDDIQQVYLEQVEKDKKQFENNIKHYEFYTHYHQSDIWYVPEGFRRFIRIVLPVDKALLDNYYLILQEGKDASEQKLSVLNSVSETLDTIYAQVKDGESFAAAIKQYSSDPYEAGNTLETGYLVHRESSIYEKGFLKAAFAQEMQIPGSVSQPAIIKEGVCVLYYVKDEPEGPVELNEQMKASISTYLAIQKKNTLVEEWVKEYPLKIEEVVGTLK